MSPTLLCAHGGRLERCPICSSTKKGSPNEKGQQGRVKRTWAERKRRAAVVEAHRARFGDWCWGWNREPHFASDLTADHLQPQSMGGASGPLGVLCRSCNARKGALGGSEEPESPDDMRPLIR